MAKAIKFMGQNEKFEKCLNEAWGLHLDEFAPELDNLESKTISSVMFKVLSERDLAIEGHTNVPSKHINKVDKFLSRWKNHIENDDEKAMYRIF
ncbi:hypothetical protein [Bacillus sp. TH008]|uniref:hypothetical protein n=1 Tax=Bacillus sp. TH008 TaxID=1609979 RepID=UPI00061747CA|nr:hypothetical protein [Bacillus sp. TH008]KKB71989.1 hypothetical protein TH62_20550 [Bacillus sp. TH008]